MEQRVQCGSLLFFCPTIDTWLKPSSKLCDVVQLRGHASVLQAPLYSGRQKLIQPCVLSC